MSKKSLNKWCRYVYIELCLDSKILCWNLESQQFQISHFLTIKDAVCDFSPKTHESHKKPWRSLSNASIWRGVCQETRLGNPSLNLTCKKFAFHATCPLLCKSLSKDHLWATILKTDWSFHTLSLLLCSSVLNRTSGPNITHGSGYWKKSTLHIFLMALVFYFSTFQSKF